MNYRELTSVVSQTRSVVKLLDNRNMIPDTILNTALVYPETASRTRPSKAYTNREPEDSR